MDISETFVLENNCRNYSLELCYRYLHQVGKKTYGAHFNLKRVKAEVLYKLLIYAIRDEETAAKLHVNLQKGLLLMGPAGSGKTSLMHLLKPFFYRKNQYIIKNCRELAIDFNRYGFETLAAYTKATSPIYCLDDLGNEVTGKHFGASSEVMKEILQLRYELYQQYKKFTYVTTNLTAAQLEKRYGRELRLKMREMFEVFVLT